MRCTYIRNHIPYLFFRKLCSFLDIVKRHDTARQITDGNITQRMRIACWINRAIAAHSEYVIFFYGNDGIAKAPHPQGVGGFRDTIVSVKKNYIF